jgi:arsenite-transporting ATPase
LSRQPPPVAGLDAIPGLEVRTVDPQGDLEGLWQAAAGPVAAALPQVRVPPASSVVPLPGAGILALFADLAAADADLVVVDAGPASDAATLVALPATLRWWLDQILPPGIRALGAVRTAAVASGTARRGRRAGRGAGGGAVAPVRSAGRARGHRRLPGDPGASRNR